MASATFKSYIQEFGRQVALKLTHDGTEVISTGIKSMTYTRHDKMLSSSMRALDVILQDEQDLRGNDFTVDLGVSFDGSEYEYEHLGTFTPHDETYDFDYAKNETSFTAYDKMLRAHKSYNLELSVPAGGITVGALLQAMNSALSFTMTQTGYVNENAVIAKDDYDLMLTMNPSFRDVYDYIAQITASNLHIEGNEVVLTYVSDSGFTFDGSNLSELRVTERVGPINRITFERIETVTETVVEDGEQVTTESTETVVYKREDATSIASNGVSEISIKSNPIINDSMLDAVFNTVKGITYYTYDIASYGFCFFSPMETVSIEYADHTYPGIIESDVITVTDGGVTEMLYAEKATQRTDDSVTDNSDKTAIYTEAQYEKLYIDRLEALSAYIQNLSVDDLQAGTINTDEITIASDDGNMILEGNTQTFKDANGNTRIVLGQDANGNYTLKIYDASGNLLMDETGVKTQAIPQSIKDDVSSAVSDASDAIEAVNDIQDAIENGDFDGEDATVLRIDSTRGLMFKNNNVSTVLNVTIYSGPDVITTYSALTARYGASAYLQWYWQRIGETTFYEILSTDTRLSNNGFSLTLTPSDVDTKVTFMCKLIV